MTDQGAKPSTGAYVPEAQPVGVGAAGRVCPHCNHQNAPGSNFCSSCGTNMVDPQQNVGQGMPVIPGPAAAGGNMPPQPNLYVQ